MRVFWGGFLAGGLGAAGAIGVFWRFILPRLLGKTVAASVYTILVQLGQINRLNDTGPIQMERGEFFVLPEQDLPC